MRVTLNLATRPFADLGPANKRLRIGMGVLALLAILLGLGLHLVHRKAEAARARDHSLDGQIARITQERQGYQDLMKLPVNHQVLVEAQALNKLFDEKTFSWTLAMEDLETVLPGGVMVSTIEPVREKDGNITLHLHVIGARDRAVELVSNLEHSKRFLFPRIIGENSESTGGAGQKMQPVSASNQVNFELLAEYNPATAEERLAAAKAAHAAEIAASQPLPAPKPVLPLYGISQPPRPQAVAPQPAPPASSPQPNPNSQRLRPLARRGRRNPGNPDQQPGGPQ